MATVQFFTDVFAIFAFAIVATALRQAIAEALRPQVSPPLFPELAANFLGCLVMGFSVTSKPRMIQWTCSSFHLGVCTGFCGSLTTLSTWAVFSAKQLVHLQSKQDSPNFTLCIGSWVIGLSVALFGFQLGRHISYLLDFYITEEPASCPIKSICTVKCVADIPNSPTRSHSHSNTPTHSNSQIRASILLGGASICRNDSIGIVALEDIPDSQDIPDIMEVVDVVNHRHYFMFLICFFTVTLFLLFGSTALLIFDSNRHRSEVYWMPSLWASIGALLRWQLSKLNKIGRIDPTFPIGTLIANSTATIVAASCEG